MPDPATPDEEALQGSFVPLYRLTRPFYDNLFAAPMPQPYERPDPSSYREVSAYEAPLALQPVYPKTGVVTWSPFAGIAQSWDSNLLLTSANHVSDTYTTLAAGTDFQIGSPDSIYNTNEYDSILALHGRYYFSTDLFAEHEELNAVNNRLHLDGRIGRDAAIWRPYVTVEQFTSTDFQDRNVQGIGRLQRQILSPGLQSNYKIDSNLTYNQNFFWSRLLHPQGSYVNTDTYVLQQDFGVRVLENVDFIVWNELRQTQPSLGSEVGECTSGIGWRGMPDPRIFTEFRIGWDAMEWSDGNPGRQNLPAWRMDGHTTFEWSPRLSLGLKYSRAYVFNEVLPNNNYTSTGAQFVPQVFLGGNFYLTPYISLIDYSYEQQHLEQLECRLETELAYRFGGRRDADSRVYVKVACLRLSQQSGDADQGRVDDARVSLGMAYRF